MIIILNGMLGTNIENLAKIISLNLNVYNKNFLIDVDKNGSLNIQPEQNDSNKYIHIANAEPIFVTTHDETNMKEINLYSFVENLNFNFINSYLFDNKITMQPDFFDEDDKPEYIQNEINFSPESIMKRRKASKFNYFVICGQIGEFMINEIKKISDEEVKVYNIIRNPSVSELIFKNYFNVNKEEIYTFDSFNAVNLKNKKDVITLKFEDLFKSSQIEIADEIINLGPEFLSDANVFTSYELENAKIKKIKPIDIRRLNIKYKSLQFYVNPPEDKNEIARILLNGFESIPEITKNIFEELQYEEIK